MQCNAKRPVFKCELPGHEQPQRRESSKGKRSPPKREKVPKKKAVKERRRKRVSQVTEKGSPGSVFWVLLPTRDARQRGQMSDVITVKPDNLQLAISYCREARGQAGAKTMPTPLCDDQCLRRLCKMAAAKPTHYYESLALRIQPPPSPPPPPAPPLLSKEVPSVSDSGASAIYSECSKQICHFCIWRARVRAYYHWQGCLLS